MVAHPQHDDNFDIAQGLPMTEEAFEQLTNSESPYRYELIDGRVYDMTGSSPEHSEIISNIDLSLREQIGRAGPCHTFRDQYVLVPNNPPVVPDLVLSCAQSDWDRDKRLQPFKIQSPLLVFEVLSPSTERYGRGEKFICYRLCASLEVYVLVSQKKRQVEVFRRSTGWLQELFSAEQVINLKPLDLELALDAIYEEVL